MRGGGLFRGLTRADPASNLAEHLCEAGPLQAGRLVVRGLVQVDLGHLPPPFRTVHALALHSLLRMIRPRQVRNVACRISAGTLGGIGRWVTGWPTACCRRPIEVADSGCSLENSTGEAGSKLVSRRRL